ncbi:hypothetical protein Tco_0605802 [Tanacetum coccineum]
MIGCKSMRTLASAATRDYVEFKDCNAALVVVSAMPRPCKVKLSTDSDDITDMIIIGHACHNSRVPVPLPEDPYEAIRQAYLDGTDTESEPFEDPIDTEDT